VKLDIWHTGQTGTLITLFGTSRNTGNYTQHKTHETTDMSPNQHEH
jgi:hypothetical protein